MDSKNLTTLTSGPFTICPSRFHTCLQSTYPEMKKALTQTIIFHRSCSMDTQMSANSYKNCEKVIPPYAEGFCILKKVVLKLWVHILRWETPFILMYNMFSDLDSPIETDWVDLFQSLWVSRHRVYDLADTLKKTMYVHKQWKVCFL